jgi:hypothetical protein
MKKSLSPLLTTVALFVTVLAPFSTMHHSTRYFPRHASGLTGVGIGAQPTSYSVELLGSSAPSAAGLVNAAILIGRGSYLDLES